MADAQRPVYQSINVTAYKPDMKDTQVPKLTPETINNIAEMGQKTTGGYKTHLLGLVQHHKTSKESKNRAPTDLVILDQVCNPGALSAEVLHILDDNVIQLLDLTMTDIGPLTPG